MMNIAAKFFMVIASVATAACAGPASAEDGEWLKRAIAKARDGEIIEIPAGDYNFADLKIRRNLTLKGASDGETVFHSSAVTEKGLLVPLTGVTLTVENIIFRDAASWDRNGAGIRHEGRDLNIFNCTFDGNEDGVLATGDANGIITIRSTKFIDNGFGDGQSHGIYVSSGAKLDISDSRFVGTKIGHHVKSLAGETIIANTHFDDAHGRTSYAVDASRGGKMTIVGSTLIQSVDSDNQAIINYDLTRGGEAYALRMENNIVVNHYPGGVLLRNDTKIAPVFVGNKITNNGKRPLRLVSAGSPAPLGPE